MDPAEDCAALIKGTGFFGGILADLPAETRALFAKALRPVRYETGQMIFARGDAGDFLLVVGSGRIRLSLVTEEGRELSVRHGVTGDVIGEIALLDGGARSADALAMTPVQGFILTRADFQALMQRFPELSSGLIRFLCAKLRSTTDQLEAIALHPIEARLARFLLVALGGRKAEAGKKEGGKTEGRKRVPLELGFSQSELAQLLGASRPKVNGALSLLEEQGAIKRTPDRLFCDPVLLAHTARLHDEP